MERVGKSRDPMSVNISNVLSPRSKILNSSTLFDIDVNSIGNPLVDTTESDIDTNIK